ncbi:MULTISPECIES: polyprenyl synthetase family protein [Bacillus]|uniref:polyprenyl synthetase family protein n=1 Tax=Bacillus TaxID=1386 RepID=UPI00041895BC|nr:MULTISPECIES: polyprenyl synthetase family protein [Bacillus]AII38131.1 isoprenyl transferase [Bacillus subtilis TO-A]AKN15285.1 pre-ComX modifying enzyme [Bacillus subtilis]EXF55431.1 isoprenyl transferase [Bacillus subtilis QH-1]MBU8592625.1 polyprenyl synthetase family protein [Bacillus subtilis]MBY0126742.1 polyprenyl synthetase family protein [Bacillus subtilis]
MKEIVSQKIMNQDLERYLQNFIESKDTFEFADLALHHYLAFNGQDQKAIELLAAGIELLILSFDIYDDLEDQDNGSAVWMKIDSSIALNAVTALYTLSIQVMCQASHEPEFSQEILNFALQSIQGQHDDIVNAPQTEEACLEMIKNKSGALTALPCVMGVMLATGKYHPIVASYSYELGIIAQIENDYKGLFYLNNDFVQKKNTLAYLYLKKQFNDASAELLSLYQKPEEFVSINTKALKRKLTEAGVIQYLLVMKHLSLQKIKNEMSQLKLEEDKTEKLLSVMIK